jgi:2-iminobutanoate/2-iminopropanoate deaminase
MKKIIATDKAPKAIGPYSQAVEFSNLIFISGQLPINPLDGKIPADIKGQTRQSLENIKNILNSQNLKMENILKTTVYMSDLSKFQEMNEVYGEFFLKEPPARATVEVKALPKNVMVEIEAIAYRG